MLRGVSTAQRELHDETPEEIPLSQGSFGMTLMGIARK
jgi:hypothetical protein